MQSDGYNTFINHEGNTVLIVHFRHS